MSYCVTFARAKYTTKRKFGDEPAQKQLLIPFQVAMRSLDLWGQYFVNFIHFFPVFFFIFGCLNLIHITNGTNVKLWFLVPFY